MRLRKRVRYARDFWLTLRKHRLPLRAALSAAYRMSAKDLFSPQEILRLGLLSPSSPLAAMSRTTSKEALLRIQTRLNPANHWRLTEDKIEFFAACGSARLSTPSLHAIYSKSGRTLAGVRSLTTEQDLGEFLVECAHADLVLKPADGTHAEGVLVLSRHADGRWAARRQTMSARDVQDFVAASASRDWLLQQRLRGSRALRELSGTDLLQTARVVTLASEDGRCEALVAWLRIVSGRVDYDNFNFGTAGNIVAAIDLRSGEVRVAAKACEDGLGLEPVTEHPITGQRIAGFRIPFWREILLLTRKAGMCFAPLRTVGWDVAITDEGPLLVEGNVTWDPLPANPDLGTAVDRLKHALVGTMESNLSSRAAR